MKNYTQKLHTFALGISFVLGLFAVFLVAPQSALAWNLQGSCAGVPAMVNVGDTVTWTATRSSTGTASNSHYEYSWSGTNSLSGTSQSVSKVYTTAGTKNATVIITLVINAGGTETITRSCSITVNTPPPPPPTLVTSCAAVPTSVIVGAPVAWSSTATGGTGTYTYSWSGDESLSGASAVVNKSYTSVGAKNASVTIVSGAQTSTASCAVTVITPPPPPPAPLEGLCSASPAVVQVGDNVNWSATATGGIGSYTYTWSGTNSLSGTSQSVSKVYTTAGTKNASAVITSGSQSVTRSCQVTITQLPPPPPPALAGSCAVTPTNAHIGDTISWSSTATGGTGTYVYVWSGDESLSSTSAHVSKTYNAVGTKNASVTITSGTSTVTYACTVDITNISPPPPSSTPLDAICSVAPSTIRAGESATWSTTASGGTGTYTYDWTGSEGLADTMQSITKSYPIAGSKSATVTVTSGSETKTATCSIIVLPPIGCTSSCGGGGFNQPTVVLLKKPPVGQVLSAVFLSQVPYTGFGDGYKVSLFLLVLGIWSAAALYFFRAKLWRRKRDTLVFNGHTAGAAASAGYATSVQKAPSEEGVMEVRGEEALENGDASYTDINQIINSPMYTESIIPNTAVGNTTSNGIIDIIAAEAQRNHVIISEEGMKIIADKGKHDAAVVLSLVGSVVKNAEVKYDREDGWLLLNKEKVNASVNASLANTSAAPANTIFGRSNPVHAAPVSPRISAAASASLPTENRSSVDSSLFVSWLASGDKQQVARYLKTLRDQLGSPDAFLKKVVLDLDVVYRSRFDEVEETIDERLANTVAGLSNAALEDLIAVLLSTLDQNYRSSSLGIKLALMRAAEVSKRR